MLVLIASSLSHIPGTADSTSGSPIAQVLWGGAYTIALVVCLNRRRFLGSFAKACIPLFLILTLVMLSTLWSIDPYLTVRRAVGLCGTSAIGFYLCSRYSLRAFVETFVIAMSIMALICAFLIVFVPSEGVDVDGSSWRGVFFQKNGLGVNMAIATASMLTLLNTVNGRRRILLIAAMALSTILLLGSKSGTGFVTLITLVTCYFFFLRLRVPNLRVPALVFTSVLVVLLACAHAIGLGASDALGLIGRDATFTGRTDVWSIALEHIADRPILGYGYRVFWEPTGPVHAYLQQDIGWEPDSAHDGYLEVMLNFGIVGAFVFLAFLLLGLSRATRLFVRCGAGVGAWPLLAILYQVASNFTETSLAMYNTVGWVVLVTAFLYASESEAELAAAKSSAAATLRRFDTVAPAASRPT